MNYPNQLDDKNSLFEVKDLGRTSTSKPINAVELEIEIDNPINFPTGRHIVVIESEVIIISHRIDNILYVEKRGSFDTLSENHITNSKIGVVFTSAHYETLRDTIIDIQKELWTYRKPVNDVLNDPQTIIPIENESYLVGLSPLNEFIGKENNIATWNGTSWDFISPQPAFEMYILNKGKYEFNGTSWILNKDVEISNVNDLQNQLNDRYTKSESDNLLDIKVDKETGKNLVEDTKISSYDNHLVNTTNPHNVTASQVGAYSKTENDNILAKKANLDVNNKIPLSEIPDSILGQLKYMGVWNFSSGLPIGAQKGNYWIASVSGNGYEVGDWAVFNGTNFDKVDNTDAVSSVAGRTGNVVLNKNDVGLNNVDNTSDLNKPISNATQTALDTTVKLTGNQTITGAKTFSGLSKTSIGDNALEVITSSSNSAAGSFMVSQGAKYGLALNGSGTGLETGSFYFQVIDRDLKNVKNTSFRIGVDGRVGIGATNPLAKLQTSMLTQSSFASPSNCSYYNRGSDNGYGIGFGTLNAGLEGASFIQTYINDSSTDALPLLISPAGNQTRIGGFTKLGSDAPAIKYKKITGRTSSTQGGEVYVRHGLNGSKILSASILIDYIGTGNGDLIQEGELILDGWYAQLFTNKTHIVVRNAGGSFKFSSTHILNKPFTVLITYEE